MKMLIVLDRYYPECNSATALIDNIIPPLSKYFEITVACVKSDRHSPDREIRKGVRIIRKHTFCDYPEMIRKQLIDRIYDGRIENRLLRFVLSRIVMFLFSPFRLLERSFGIYNIDSYSRRFGHMIEDEISASDVVLTTVMPYQNANTLCPVLEKYPDVKWVIIQSDPYVDYSADPAVIQSKEDDQNRWYERADLVVAQETILDNIYRGSSGYKDRILPLFIPSMPSIVTDDKLSAGSEKTVLNRLNDTHRGASRRISCVYTGVFYTGVREPFFLMDIFARLHEADPDIEVYVLGPTYDHKIPGFNKQNADWFFFCGRQPREVCYAAQLEADFLINVGNMVPDLVPSKVMQYISTRKPIINLYHMKNDVVENYLADYPLKLSLYYDDYGTGDDAVSDHVNKLKEFIISNVGKAADYDSVIDRFDKYSAENYVKTIMDHDAMRSKDNKHEFIVQNK